MADWCGLIVDSPCVRGYEQCSSQLHVSPLAMGEGGFPDGGPAFVLVAFCVLSLEFFAEQECRCVNF